jgi:hypothetical protein
MKSKKYSEIPPWFDIKNYRMLNMLSEEALTLQLEFRIELLNSYNFHTDGDDTEPVSINDFLYPGELRRWATILSGNPIVESNWEVEALEYEELMPLPHSEQNSVPAEEIVQRQAIADWTDYEKRNNTRLPATASFSGLNTLNFVGLYEKLKKTKTLNESSPLAGIKNEHFLADINLVLNEKARDIDKISTVFLALRLGKCTDREILEDLRTLLPLWREELGLPEPSKQKPHPSLFNKVKSNQVIPYLDLYIWQLFNKCKITQEKQALALDCGGKQRFIDVVKNHAEKILKFYEQKLEAGTYRY